MAKIKRAKWSGKGSRKLTSQEIMDTISTIAQGDWKKIEMMARGYDGDPIQLDPHLMEEFYSSLAKKATDRQEIDGFTANAIWYKQMGKMLKPGGVVAQPGW